MFSISKLGVITGLAAFFCLRSGSARAATLTVTSSDDHGPGTLRRVVADAASGDLIVMGVTDLDGPIRLTRGPIVLNKNLTLRGPQSGSLTLNGIGLTRIFDIPDGSAATVAIRGLHFKRGRTPGAGGAIRHRGTGLLTLRDCDFSINHASGRGGAVAAFGPLEVLNCRFAGNSSSDQLNGGGAIYTAGGAHIQESRFSANISAGYGGGVDADGSISIVSCLLENNGAVAGGGGLIAYQSGSVTVSQTTFDGNSSLFQGGAADIEETDAQFLNCTFSGNSVPGDGIGAGIYHVTYSANNSKMLLVNCTIANSLGGAGLYTDAQDIGDGLGQVQTRVLNTVIANSPAENVFSDNSTAVTSLGHNLSSDNSAPFNAAGDLNGLDPKLSALGFYQGFLPTIKPLIGSPLLDAGDDAVLGAPYNLAFDARGAGFGRRSGSHVDIGAFERQASAAPNSTATF